MKCTRHADEFKLEVAKQVCERGYSVADVAQRLFAITHSLYAWIKKCDEANPGWGGKAGLETGNVRFKADFGRMIEERDILKKAGYFARDNE